jgi:uncharacterized protein GlcG (DUF336 family)
MRHLLIGAVAALGLAMPAQAADDDALNTFQTLEPDLAVELAQAALQSCRDGGYQVAVVVVDRFGETQTVIRDRFAGPHTIDTATRKAWTAVSFREETQELDERINAGELTPGLRGISEALVLGGGVPVMSAGSIVGGVGVSGAPEPQLDEDCAAAGIDAIYDRIAF